MKGLSISCTVRDGKLRLFDRRSFDDGLRQFGDGEDLILRVETAEAGRTRAQEKFFHGPVLKAFMSLGYTKQEAKDVLALRFLPREVRRLDGSVVIVPGHTSRLTKADYTAFIESCIQLAAELDLYIADAEEWRQQQRSRVA